MPSFSAWAFSISTPRLSLCPVFFIPFFLSFFFFLLHYLSPSAPLLFQWASNWGSVIGREKRLGENESLWKERKKGKRR